MVKKLLIGFTDLRIGGKDIDRDLFLPGDEIDVISFTSGCPDLGCCETEFTFRHPAFPDEIFTGWTYYRNVA